MADLLTTHRATSVPLDFCCSGWEAAQALTLSWQSLPGVSKSHCACFQHLSLSGTSAFLDSQSSPNGWPSVLPLDNNGEDKSEPQKERGPWRRRKPAANLALVLHNCSFELNCRSEQRERRQSVCSTKNGCNNTSDFDVREAYSKGTYFSFHFPLPKTFSMMFHLNMCLV